jgi:hypothetical protein
VLAHAIRRDHHTKMGGNELPKPLTGSGKQGEGARENILQRLGVMAWWSPAVHEVQSQVARGGLSVSPRLAKDLLPGRRHQVE